MDSAVCIDGRDRHQEVARYVERHSDRYRNGLLVLVAISRLRRQLDWIYHDLLFQEARNQGLSTGGTHMFGLFESNEQKADKACAKGCMALMLGRHKNAVEHFKKAVWLNPYHYEAWNNFGVVLSFQPAALQEAKKCFEKALSLKPDYLNSIRGLAVVEKMLGNEKHSLELFRRLIKDFGYNPCKDETLSDSFFDWLNNHHELFDNV